MKFYVLLTLKLNDKKEHLRDDMDTALEAEDWMDQDRINTTWVKEVQAYNIEGVKAAENEALNIAKKSVSKAFSEAKVTNEVIAMIQAGINKPVVI